jgi:hypothetical protein
MRCPHPDGIPEIERRPGHGQANYRSVVELAVNGEILALETFEYLRVAAGDGASQGRVGLSSRFHELSVFTRPFPGPIRFLQQRVKIIDIEIDNHSNLAIKSDFLIYGITVDHSVLGQGLGRTEPGTSMDNQK